MYSAGAVKKPEWLSIYVILFLKNKSMCIKRLHVSSENSEIFMPEFTCVCSVVGFFFTKAPDFC